MCILHVREPVLNLFTCFCLVRGSDGLRFLRKQDLQAPARAIRASEPTRSSGSFQNNWAPTQTLNSRALLIRTPQNLTHRTLDLRKKQPSEEPLLVSVRSSFREDPDPWADPTSRSPYGSVIYIIGVLESRMGGGSTLWILPGVCIALDRLPV